MTSKLKVVAAGDSWNYKAPLDLGTGGGIANALFGRVMGITDYPNVSKPGDSTEQLLGLSMSLKLIRALPGAKILLFFGGGDNFIGDSLYEYVYDRSDVGGDVNKAIDWFTFNAQIQVILATYGRLKAIRDKYAPGCLIVTGSYDFVPAEMMGKGFLDYGPWIAPSMRQLHWTDPEEMAAVMKLFLQEFEFRLATQAAQDPLHTHVNTQIDGKKFANEAHKNYDGCMDIAEVMNVPMLPLLDKIANEP